MSADLLNLPENVFFDILCFLDDYSILRLREANKPSRAMIDSLILKSRKTQVTCFSISTLELILEFPTFRDYWIWKISLYSMRGKLGMNVIENDDDNCILITMFAKKLHELITLLKSNTRVIFHKLDFLHPEKEADYMFFDIFEGKTIPSLYVSVRNFYTIDWLNFICKVKAKEIHCFLTEQEESSEVDKFLCKLADVMQEIMVMNYERESFSEIVSIMHNILSRRCEKLSFSVNNVTGLSSDSVYALLQMFHHIEKKVSFTACSEAEVMDESIGMFKVKVTNNRVNRQISIEHMGFGILN